MKYRFASLLAAAAALFFTPVTLPAEVDQNSYIYPASLVQLLITPEKWADKKITVSGYLGGGVPQYLFLTREHAIAYDRDSGFLVLDETEGTLRESRCKDAFVTISGKWVEVDPGTYGLVANMITKKEQHDRDICWRADSKGRPSKQQK